MVRLSQTKQAEIGGGTEDRIGRNRSIQFSENNRGRNESPVGRGGTKRKNRDRICKREWRNNDRRARRNIGNKIGILQK